MLTRTEILTAVAKQDVIISPFNANDVGPNSYDVHLADRLYHVVPESGRFLDVKKPYTLVPVSPYVDNDNPGLTSWILEPGRLYLGATVEFTKTARYVMMLDGISTLGRYGIEIHKTAGFGDVGFEGHWTLEITATIPVRVYPNMRIGQISFHPVNHDEMAEYSHRGHYTQQSAAKPVAALPNNV